MRAKLPTTDGFVERDGREAPLRGLRARPARRWCSCRPGASSTRVSTRRNCPISASASAASPSTRAATASRTGRPMRPPTRSTTASPTPSPSWTPRMPAGHPGRICRSAACTPACWLPIIPERVKAAILVGTVATIGPGYPYMTPRHFLTKRDRFEGWDKYNRDLLAVELSRLRRALHPQHLLRAAFHQADRGRHRVGRRNDGSRAGQDRGGTDDRAAVRRRRGHVSQDPLPPAADPRRQRPDPALWTRGGSWPRLPAPSSSPSQAAVTTRSAAIRRSATI